MARRDVKRTDSGRRPLQGRADVGAIAGFRSPNER